VIICTSGYVSTVALTLKSGAATMAALAAFVLGVEVASADIIPPAVENPPPLVTPPPLVEEVVAEADEALADAQETLDEATGQATETAGQVTETAGQVTERVTETAGNAVGAVEGTIEGTPAGKVLDPVQRVVDPILKDVQTLPGAVTRPVTGQLRLAAGTTATPQNAATVAVGVALPPSSSQGLQPLSAVGAGVTWDFASADPLSASRQFGEASGQATRAGAFLPQLSSVWASQARPAAPASTSRVDDTSNAPRRPFGPLFPADTPATAALVSGAAGAALLAALFSTLFFLAPRTGRLARPGPILMRAEPCLSLPERPG
jgi:hypothetical protein